MANLRELQANCKAAKINFHHIKDEQLAYAESLGNTREARIEARNEFGAQLLEAQSAKTAAEDELIRDGLRLARVCGNAEAVEAHELALKAIDVPEMKLREEILRFAMFR